MKIGDEIFAAIDANGEILRNIEDGYVLTRSESMARFWIGNVESGHARIVRCQIVQLPTRDEPAGRPPQFGRDG